MTRGDRIGWQTGDKDGSRGDVFPPLSPLIFPRSSSPRIEFRRESREPLIFAASNLATSDFQLRGIEEWNSGEGWDRLSCDRPPVYEYLRRADGQRPMRPAQASLLRVAFRRRRGEGKRRRKKRKWRMLHGSTISQRKKKKGEGHRNCLRWIVSDFFTFFLLIRLLVIRNGFFFCFKQANGILLLIIFVKLSEILHLKINYIISKLKMIKYSRV